MPYSKVIRVEIDKEGKVLSAEAVAGHPLLRQSAVEAAKKAKFKPEGYPAKRVKGVIVYKFHSDKNCDPEKK